MITYNDIYAVLRQEKYNETLQKLPKNFIEELREYIKEKQKILQKEADSFDEAIAKLRKQFENAKTLIEELFRIRQKKILNLALLAKIAGVSKSDIDNMLPEEEELFHVVLNKLKELDAALNKKLKEEIREKDLKKNSLIRFKQDTPEFLDAEGNKLGPFKAGDIANLPREIAEILVDDGKAIMLE